MAKLEDLEFEFKEIADERVVTKLDKIGQAMVKIYQAIPKPVDLPKIFNVQGKVEVTSGKVEVVRTAPTRITNFSELERYFKSLEERLVFLAQAASAPAPRVEIPKFPKIEIPKADNSKIESLLEEMIDKIEGIKPSEVSFPREISVNNFPRQMIPQPVNNIWLNALQGVVKTTATTVTTTLTKLPSYGQLNNRRALQIYNNSSTVTIYIGGSDVTADNGLPVPPNSYSPSIDAGYNLLIYGVTASGSADCRIIEISKNRENDQQG